MNASLSCSNVDPRICRGRGGIPSLSQSTPASGYGALQWKTIVRGSGASTDSILFCGGEPAAANSGAVYTCQAKTKSSAVSGDPSCQVTFGFSFHVVVIVPSAS